MGKLLTREQIMSKRAESLRTEDVPVADLGGDVRVRELSVDEAEWMYEEDRKYREAHPGMKPRDLVPGLRAKVVAMAMIDGDGAPIFSPEEREEGDVGKILSIDAVNDLFPVVLRISKLTAEEVKKDLGEPGPSPSDASSSD